MVRIAVVASDSRGGNFFRLFEPLRLLMQYNDGVHYKMIDYRGADTDELYQQLIDCTHVFAHMPGTAEAGMVLIVAKSMGLKIVVTVDDYVWEMPEKHPMRVKWEEYGANNLLRACQIADVVITPNKDLNLEMIKEHKLSNTEIAPLTVPLLSFSGVQHKPYEQHKKRFVLRYGQMAEHDWYHFTGELVAIGEKHELIAIGGCPSWLKRYTSMVVPVLPTVEYFRFLYSLKPHGILYPIDRSLKFNRMRSVAAMAECVFCDASLFTGTHADHAIKFADIIDGSEQQLGSSMIANMLDLRVLARVAENTATQTYLNVFLK